VRYKIIIDSSVKDPPKSHEFLAATLLAEHFEAEVTFIRPSNFRTPDFSFAGLKWELKSPTGGSSRTIENNMRAAREQSTNLIIDLSRIKIHQQRAISRINFFLSKPNQFKSVIVITKTKKIIEIR
jgi:hypothetical protein